ncbi:hypothetical protein LAZ67_1006739 [Cordylochernes scorpioides]|uniref:CCHC-type domain-containing protein n=1 Tax=Cordylochernes scorpioides TaxID=51811 RepID=A0ABY6K1S2_9ARAC|nr:hypothetical protein LAZ67_1006739 [Cordylochernes scorpioides]
MIIMDMITMAMIIMAIIIMDMINMDMINMAIIIMAMIIMVQAIIIMDMINMVGRSWRLLLLSQDANSAAPVDLAAIPTSNAAAQVRRNWADITEEVNPGAEEGFTLVQGRKRRRGSADSPTAAAPSSNSGGARSSRRLHSSARSVPRAQEIPTTRTHITEARARQASSSEEHCVYLEHGPELQPFHYLRALDRLLGGTAGVVQVSKVNGHQLLGLANRGLAERLINNGLEVEGTLLRAFPFRKRAERITVSNLPFFVEDSAIINALRPFGRITSIAPKMMKAGPYTYTDGRREAFIVLHEGMTTERLPTRLNITIKGEAWPAYLSTGIKCSRCHGQGHRRANCPLLAGLANNTRTAPPTTPAGVPPPTTPAPPQRSAAQLPAPTPSNPAMEVCSAPPVARAALHSSAPRPSPPAAPAFPMEETPPAPPPVTPAPSLRTPGSREPAAPTPDVEMPIVEETFASSTSSAKNATRVDLDAFIEGHPSVSFAKTDALGLGREEVLDLLSSRTKAQRKGPLLSPPQCDALVGLIGQILDLRPGAASNLYKVLGQVKAELRTTPAVPPTPTLPAPWPAKPTPPALHGEKTSPDIATPPPPLSTEFIDACYDQANDIIYELSDERYSETLSDIGVTEGDIVEAIIFPDDREPLLRRLSTQKRTTLAGIVSAASERARSSDPFVREGLRILSEMLPPLIFRRNWADITEEVNPGAEEGFSLVQGRKRRRGSANSPTAAVPSSNAGGSRTIRRPQPSAGSVPRAQEIRVTRAHIAEARAQQASSSEEHCVYIEHSPELEPFHYLKALDRMLGGTAGVIQITKVNGHQLLGLTNRGLAERLISEGLEVEGTLLRAFPFRKRAERITVGNLPFFVGDSAVINALSPYGRVTSIAPKQMKAGPYVYVDGRRDIFITLHEGITIERLPTRLDINIKGEAWPAYLSSGIRCSRCHGQGHRRAISPLLAGQANNTRMAPPTTPAGVPPPTTPAPPQRSAAQPPAPAPSNPAMEVCSAPPVARAVLHPSAPRPSPPAAPTSLMEETPSAPPPVTPAPSLQVPEGPVGPRSAISQNPEPPPARPDFVAPRDPLPAQKTLGPAAPTPDVEMSIVEETFASSTSSAKNATRVDLDAFIEKHPSVSFAGTDALGLGREEVLDLLSSRTKAQRKGPLLSPPQCDALASLIRQILNLRPGAASNLYKVLGQNTPAARPGGDGRGRSNDGGRAHAPPPPSPRLAGPIPPVPHGDSTTLAMATPPPPLSTQMDRALMDKRWEALRNLMHELDREFELDLEHRFQSRVDVDDIIRAILYPGDREPLIKRIPTRDRYTLGGLMSTAIRRARKLDPSILECEDSRMADASANYANLPIDRSHANFAAACIADVTPSTSGALAAATNWAEQMEAAESGEDSFTVVKHKRRRRESPNRPVEQRSSGVAASRRTGATPRRRPTAGGATVVQEIRATRADIADARVQQRSSTEDNCVFVEHCPDFGYTHYLQAVEELVGGAGNVLQVMKMDGHMLVGLSTKALAERLLRDGLEIGHTHLRAFPFKKREERITVANLPFFVDDAAVIEALKALRNKGNVLSAIISYGVKCSRCGRQGHRRANCPINPGRASNNGQPQPAPLPPGASSTVSRQLSRPTPAAPALTMEETPSAPPPVTPAPPLQAPEGPVGPRPAGSQHPEPPPARPDLVAPLGPLPAQKTLGPAAPTPDVEMSIVEETFASSTSSAKNATRVDLDAFIEGHPSVSFAETDALGLGREEVLDLLSSRTKAQRKGPLLSPPQCDALAGLIRQKLDLRPGAASNLYKVLWQVKAELRTTPTAVSPTPPLPAPRPAEPTPPAPHGKMTTPALATSRLFQVEEDLTSKRWDEAADIIYKLCNERYSGPLTDLGITEGDITDAVIYPEDREPLLRTCSTQKKNLITEIISAAIERARDSDPFVRSSGSAGQEPGRPSIPSPTGGNKSTKNDSHREIYKENYISREYVNPPADGGNANLAAARVDVISGVAATSSSNGAALAIINWADCDQVVNPGTDDDFTVVKTKKRRRESSNSPTAATPSSNSGRARSGRRVQSSARSVPRAQEIPTTRAHITEARARQASSSEEHCVYLEHGPELQPFHYLRALDRLLGGTAGVVQVSKVNGHQLLGLANRGLAERLINNGLEVEGTLLRAFPFRKRAERITVSNLPFFVEDSAIINALRPFGRITSIAPKMMKAGPYTYTDGRREAFIVLHEGMTTERLPTRLNITIKGEAWPAYLSTGIKCSRCHGQGHRRANCPLLAGLANNTRTAPPTTPAGVPPPTTPAPPQRSAAQLPAPTPSNPAMEVCSAPPVARAALHSSAPRPSPPAAPAFPMEETPPAPPPVTPAPSLRTPGSREPAAPTPDVEMPIVEETFASSTSSAKNATRVDLDAFIEGHPSVSFAKTDALGLGREEVLDLLSSRTKAQRKGPLLSPPQCDALVGLIGQILDLRPGAASNLYKVLGQVKAELRTTPAVPPTPTLPAPWPAKPTPPALHGEKTSPDIATPPPPLSTEFIDACYDQANDIIYELSDERYSETLSDIGVTEGDIVEAIIFPDDREPLLRRLSTQKRTTLAGIVSAASERARSSDPFVREGLRILSEMLPPPNLQDANSAAPVDLAAVPTSNAAAQVRRNWADITEEVNPGAEEGFSLVQGRKRRRGSANSPTAAVPSSNAGGSRTIRRPQPSAGSVPRAQEIRVTRAHIAEARAQQASSSEEHCVYIEHSPELEPFHYLKALDRMLGGTAGVIQITKVNGHQLLGLTNRGLAERLISEGLEVEGTLLRAFPFRKRAERITVGNLPFFVGDSAVINALSPYGRVTSIAPKQMKAGPYVYVDGRRDIFITLHEGITIERLPTRLDINIKGEAWPAYLSSGIRCSRCHGQGHRRAISPLLAGQANNTRMAPPTTPAGVPPPTTPAPPQRSAAQPPAPAPSNPAMEVCSAPPVARAVLHPSAPRPSPPAAPTSLMEETPSAPPPVTPAPSLQVPEGPVGPRSAISQNPEPPPARPDFVAPRDPLPAQKTLGPAAPTPDVEMSIVEETFASSTSSAKNATRVDLDAFIEKHPSVSFAGTDALGLGREEVLDLLSSRTKAQRKGPLLSPPQCDALASLIRQILNLRPGAASNLYKVLGQNTPAARPGGDGGGRSNDGGRAHAPPPPSPRLAGPIPPVPHGDSTTLAMATPPPPLSTQMDRALMDKRWEALRNLMHELDREFELDLEHRFQSRVDVDDIIRAILYPGDREPLIKRIPTRDRYTLGGLMSTAIRRARKLDPSILECEDSRMADASANYANLPIDRSHANFAAACIADVTPSTSGALAAATNWAEQMEAAESGEDSFTVVKHKRRRRESPNRPVEQRSSGVAASRRTGATPRRRPTAGGATVVQEIRATRADIADARVQQRSSTEDNCVFVEHCPDFGYTHYLQAVEELVGGAGNVLQVMKMDGHMLVGLSTKALAERLLRDGLEIGHTHLRAFPFKKREERITVANLPFFVDDAAVIEALKALRNKGNVLSAIISYGVKCSRCGRQGHRRANCPINPGRASNNGQPQPAPLPPGASSTVSRQLSRPTPAAPALTMEETPSAPPPVTPAPPLQAPEGPVGPRPAGSQHPEPPPARPDLVAPLGPLPAQKTLGPAAPTPDVEMSIVEETFASSTSSAKNATRVDLDAFIEGHPSVSFAETDALGLGREEVLDLLSSRTKAQRKGPLLSPPQCDALAGLIRQKLDLRPGAASNLYKVLWQVKAELRTTPTAVSPTPPLPAPRPAEPTPPAPHGKMTTPALATSRLFQVEEDLTSKRWDEAADIIYKLCNERYSGPLTDLGITEGDITDAVIYPEDREPLLRTCSTQKKNLITEIISAAIERARDSDPFVREGLYALRRLLVP